MWRGQDFFGMELAATWPLINNIGFDSLMLPVQTSDESAYIYMLSSQWNHPIIDFSNHLT